MKKATPTDEARFPGIEEIRKMALVEDVSIGHYEPENGPLPKGTPYLAVTLREGLVNRNDMDEETVLPAIKLSIWPDETGYENSLGFTGVEALDEFEAEEEYGYPLYNFIASRDRWSHPFNYPCIGDFSSDYKVARSKSFRDSVACALTILQTIY